MWLLMYQESNLRHLAPQCLDQFNHRFDFTFFGQTFGAFTNIVSRRRQCSVNIMLLCKDPDFNNGNCFQSLYDCVWGDWFVYLCVVLSGKRNYSAPYLILLRPVTKTSSSSIKGSNVPLNTRVRPKTGNALILACRY